MRLQIHVTPRGSRNEIVGWRNGVLSIKITAPPVEGAANKSCVEFVAEVLGIKKSQVRLAAGEKSREKVLLIEGLSETEVRDRIDASFHA